jgi:flagellar basal body P-ring formation protein FlgA
MIFNAMISNAMTSPVIHLTIRLAALSALTTLALTSTSAAGEFPARTPTPEFTQRFGGAPIKVLTTNVVASAPEAPVVTRPTLKAEATVIGDVVRVGDLVENAGEAADVAIFRAPDIGQTGTVPASRVLDAVLPHRVLGLDTRGLAEVVVTRASRPITGKDIETRILRALAGQSGLPDADSLTVTFDNEIKPMQVEAAITADLRIVRLGYDPRSGRFDISLELPGSAIARKLPMRFTGSISETFEAMVPTRAIAQGEVVRASDLVPARRPKSESAPNVIREVEQAAGMVAKRALRAGQAIRQSDFAKQELVARNQSVTISYDVPGITVSIRGQALEPGGQDDLINVLNVQSKKTLQAIVTGPGRVSVGNTPASARVATLPSNNAR